MTKTDTYKKKAVKGIAWSTIEKLSNQAISLIVFIILGRLLTPKDFGLIALAVIYIELLNIFIDQGLGEAITQRDKIEDSHINGAFWLSFIIGLFFAAIGYLAAPVASKIYSEPELTKVIQVLSSSFIFIGLTMIPQAILRREFRFKTLALRTLFSRLLAGTAAVIIAIQGYGVWALVANQLIITIVSMVVIWLSVNWRPSFSFSVNKIKEIIGFGIGIMGHRFIAFFDRRMDSMVLGYFMGPEILGYYTIGTRIVFQIWNVVQQSVTSVLFPLFSRLQNNRVEMLKTFNQVVYFMGIFTIPIFIILFFWGDSVVFVLFGEKWAKSVIVLKIFSISAIGYVLLGNVGPLLLGKGEVKSLFYTKIICTIFKLLSFIIAAQYSVIVFTSSHIFIVYVIILPLYLVLLNKKIGFKNYKLGIDILKIIIITVIANFIVLISKPYLNILIPNLNSVFYILPVILLYIILIRFFDKSSFQFFKETLKRALPSLMWNHI